MKVEEIAEAVAKLPPDQLARFHRWFTAFRNSNQVTVISVTHLPRNPPFYGAVGGGQRADYSYAFLFFYSPALRNGRTCRGSVAVDAARGRQVARHMMLLNAIHP